MESRLGAAWIVGRTGHALVALLDPVGRNQPQRAALHALAHHAAQDAQMVAIYKCTARTAAVARQMGWQVAALGQEAIINPQNFVLDGAPMAALRRKLRRAEAAGVRLSIADPRGAAERAAIARLWARARKNERGFSTGRYAEAYLADQLVIEARRDGQLVAFASFHQGRAEWTLDLMRNAPNCPDGTMQAIVTHGILLARAAGMARLSLAAAGTAARLPAWLARRFAAREMGLLRFKQLFAPKWQPLYITAPSRLALIVAAAEIARAVHLPAPLPRPRRAHNDLAANEIAQDAQAWHTDA
jgi:phosphatidylglycerol lysyltransferase